MKRLAFIFCIILLTSFFITGCQSSKEEQEVRKVAWDHLSDIQKSLIKGSWKDAKVKKFVLKNDILQGTPYDGKEVYLVDFPTEGNPTEGGIGVYISTDAKTFIRFALMD
ncbi:hypothetical protein ACFDTO_21515 [Microbacteriaceae bacterium 4G12]